MRTLHGMMTLLLVGQLAGCAAAHGSDEVAPGIYDLTIRSELDACSPVRASGALGPVAVLVEGGAIDVPVPDIDPAPLVSPRVRLSPDGLFHAETNRRVPGCEGAWVHEEWTAIEPGPDGFTISHLQRWGGLAGCDSGAMPSAPAADCESERLLHYTLAERCVAPCTLRLTAGAAVECVCE